MICRHCGFKVPEGSEFCDNCGHKLRSVGFMDRFDEIREDDITHEGEQPRKTDVFANRVQDAPGATTKKIKKPAAKRTSRSTGGGNKTSQAGKITIGTVIAILFVIIQLIISFLDW